MNHGNCMCTGHDLKKPMKTVNSPSANQLTRHDRFTKCCPKMSKCTVFIDSISIKPVLMDDLYND